MVSVVQDFRHSLRQLRRNPGFALAVIVTLALGIGANTAVFSVINAILLTPLPYRQPDRLVQVYETMRSRTDGLLNLSVPTYLDLKQRSRSFEAMAAFQRGTANLTGAGDPEQINSFAVSSDFWKVLGISPLQGRLFTPEDTQRNTVVLLDYNLWQNRFNGDPAIVGKTIHLDLHPATVVGVLPKDFRFHAPPRFPQVDAFTLLDEQQAARARRDSGGYEVIARLKPGIALSQAQQDLAQIAASMSRDYREYEGVSWTSRSLSSVLFGEIKPSLLIVLAVVICVLLVACMNVAGLLLVWSLQRRSEICVRLALGATQSRMVRQFITESLLLTLMGAGLGLLLANGSFHFLLSLIPASTPIGGQIGINTRVLLFTLASAILTALVFGVCLAISRDGRNLHQGLLEAGSRLTGSQHTRRIQRTIVITEIALAFILTIGAGLMTKTFTHLLAIDPGFHPRHVYATRIQLSGNTTNRTLFFENLTKRVQTLPGIETVAVASSLPMRGPHSGTYFDIPGRVAPSGQRLIEFIQVISPDYFRLMATPFRAGREFTNADRADTPGVIIVNQSFARKYWPNQNPLGKHLEAYKQNWEIVGVVEDIREFNLLGEIEPVVPLIYFPHTQYQRPEMHLIIRTDAMSSALANDIRKQVLSLDPNQPMSKFVSMDQVLTESVGSQRTMAVLMSCFGALALLLSITGVYGLISYSVLQQRDEFGIRLALGARPANIFSAVLKNGLKTILAGIGFGLAGAVAATRLIASKLYGVGPLNPAMYVTVSLVMLGVAILACVIPAQRAAKTDPLEALHWE